MKNFKISELIPKTCGILVALAVTSLIIAGVVKLICMMFGV